MHSSLRQSAWALCFTFALVSACQQAPTASKPAVRSQAISASTERRLAERDLAPLRRDRLPAGTTESLVGTLGVLAVDFVDGSSATHLSLTVEGDKTLRLSAQFAGDVSRFNDGDPVAVTGVFEGDVIFATAIEPIAMPIDSARLTRGEIPSGPRVELTGRLEGLGERDDGSAVLMVNGEKPVPLSTRALARGLALKNGDSVSVSAVMVDGVAVATSVTALWPPFSGTAPMKVYRTAIILLNFEDLPVEIVDPAQLKQQFFSADTSDAESVNGFYDENTHGLIQFAGALDPNGDVFGWYTLPFSSSSHCGSGLQTAAKAAAAQQGFVATNYDKVVYVFPYTSACALDGAAGWSHVPSTEIFVVTNFMGTYRHELGHSLGLLHAASKECYRIDTIAGGNGPGAPSNSTLVQTPEQEPGGWCTVDTYGDESMMGVNGQHHFNAIAKHRLGVYAPSQETLIHYSPQPQQVFVSPSDTQTPQAKFVGVEVAPGHYWYFESRASFGVFETFDATDPWVTGLSVRADGDGASWGSMLLSMASWAPTLQPGDTYDSQQFQVRFTVGQWVQDPAGPVLPLTVEYLPGSACDGSSATFAANLVWASVNQYTTLTNGSSVDATLNVTNNNAACGPSTASLASLLGQLDLPPGVTIEALQGGQPSPTVNLQPGQNTIAVRLTSDGSNTQYTQPALVTAVPGSWHITFVPAGCVHQPVTGVLTPSPLVATTVGAFTMALAVTNNDSTTTCITPTQYKYRLVLTQNGANSWFTGLRTLAGVPAGATSQGLNVIGSQPMSQVMVPTGAGTVSVLVNTQLGGVTVDSTTLLIPVQVQ